MGFFEAFINEIEKLAQTAGIPEVPMPKFKPRASTTQVGGVKQVNVGGQGSMHPREQRMQQIRARLARQKAIRLRGTGK